MNPARPLGPTIAYALLSVVMTWPLAAGLTRDVPADLGDSLLNLWILGWGSERLLDLLRGAGSLEAFWNGNIFHPAPLTLTFSEHLLGLSLQTLPIYVATGNLVLCYNLLFLASFVLSGVGTYLFVHRVTGHRGAAFVAGLFYAFAPYRVGQYAHLQMLQSQWMPFVLYGLRAFFDTVCEPGASRRTAWLALGGATAALVMQGLACGHYIVFFAPIVPAYALYEVWDRGLWRDLRVWTGLAASAVVSGACSWPFLEPYIRAREVFGFSRGLGEVASFSANAWAYLTAADDLTLWGPRVQLHQQAEGGLFPGFVPLVLAVTAVVWSVTANWRTSGRAVAPERRRSRQVLEASAALLLCLCLVALAVTLMTGGVRAAVGPLTLRFSSLGRLALNAAVLAAALAVFSPRGRLWLRGQPGSVLPFAVAATLFAFLMSLGPLPFAGEKLLSGPAVFAWFRAYVPGFDGLRVPARYAMLVALFLAVAAGDALRRLADRGRTGQAVVAVLALLFLAEAWAAPIRTNVSWVGGPFERPPARVPTSATEAPPVYSYLAGMPDATTVVEFPFGDAAWDLRYVHASTFHWKRLVNGYSGHFPREYQARVASLMHIWTDPDAAWRAVTGSGATHVIVHERAFRAPEGAAYSSWVRTHGGRLVLEGSDGDLLFEVPR